MSTAAEQIDSGQAARHRDSGVHIGRVVDRASSDIARHARLVWSVGAHARMNCPVKSSETEHAISSADREQNTKKTWGARVTILVRVQVIQLLALWHCYVAMLLPTSLLFYPPSSLLQDHDTGTSSCTDDGR